MAQVLIIDDDEGMRYALSNLMRHLGHSAICASCLSDGVHTASLISFDVILLDVNLPDGDGLSAIPRLRTIPSGPEIIIITAYGNPDGAELAIRTGALDYLEKGASIHKMKLPIIRALEYRNEKKQWKSAKIFSREGIIGSSSKVQECLDLLSQASESDASVLLAGETGTGKELFARAIYKNSLRRDKNFVVVDCAVLPENLVESVLFGHEKGAFTGAEKAQQGLIKQADGGTLFLDEVGELPLKIQKAFLRVLQEHSFRPVGSSKELHSNFRLVAATNQDLESMVSQGRFRSDLLFRLRSVVIRLPALRERLDDIEELARHYLRNLCSRYGMKTKKFAPEFLEALKAYCWPGNVRELINALERSVSIARDLPTLFPVHLPTHIRTALVRASIRPGAPELPAKPMIPATGSKALPSLHSFLEITERRYMENLVSATGWDIKKACSVSGLSRSRFYERVKKHQIQRPA